MTDIDWDELRAAAVDAMGRAYAPYSRYKVGAAALVSDGRIVTGCNVENASFGLSLCAERVAAFKAVSEGLTGFDAIVVVTDAERPTPPCGPCRQILWELCGDLTVHLVALRGSSRTFRLRELLPHPFDETNL